MTYCDSPEQFMVCFPDKANVNSINANFYNDNDTNQYSQNGSLIGNESYLMQNRMFPICPMQMAQQSYTDMNGLNNFMANVPMTQQNGIPIPNGLFPICPIQMATQNCNDMNGLNIPMIQPNVIPTQNGLVQFNPMSLNTQNCYEMNGYANSCNSIVNLQMLNQNGIPMLQYPNISQTTTLVTSPESTQIHSNESIYSGEKIQNTQEVSTLNSPTATQTEVSKNPKEYDPNDVRDIDRMIEKVKKGLVKDEKLTVSKLEKQKQKATRNCLCASLIVLMCVRRKWKYEMKKRSRESTKTKTIQINKIIDENKNIICSWKKVDKISKKEYTRDNSRTEKNIIYMFNVMLDIFNDIEGCSVVYDEKKMYQKKGKPGTEMFWTRNIDYFIVWGDVYTKDEMIDMGFGIFNQVFRNQTEQVLIHYS